VLDPVVPVGVPAVDVPVPEVVLEVSVEVLEVEVVPLVEVVVPAAVVVVLVDDGGVVLVEGLGLGRVESGPAKSFAFAVLNWRSGLYSQDKRFDVNCRYTWMRGKRTPGTHADSAIPLGSVPGYAPCDGWVILAPGFSAGRYLATNHDTHGSSDSSCLMQMEGACICVLGVLPTLTYRASTDEQERWLRDPQRPHSS
jgi:hypothetical protein